MRQWFLATIRSAALATVLAAGLCAGLGAAAAYDSRSAQSKVKLIESGRAPRGGRIAFSLAELNAWLAVETTIHAPQGARNPRLVLGPATVTAYADIDFLKLRQASSGLAPGWLLRNLFAGERPVKVIARVQSGAGRARVDVERVEISGVAIEGRALDFAMDAFVRPTFPYAIVSEWFDMQYGVDRVTIGPAGAVVFMQR